MGLFSPRGNLGPKKGKKIADREQRVYEALKKRNLSSSAIASIMGNIRQENASFNPKTKNGIGALGLFQLKPGKWGKLKHYNQWLLDTGTSDSLESQVDFMVDTIYGGKKERNVPGYGNAKRLKNVFDNTNDTTAQTNAFAGLWERPSMDELVLKKRNSFTDDYYQQIPHFNKN